MEIETITQLAVATGTLSATALSMLIGYVIAEWQEHRRQSR